MSALVDNYQCLACGALTSMATGTEVPSNIPNVVTSPSGHPVKELSETAPVVLAPVLPPEEVEPEVEEEVEEEVKLTHDIDLSTLTPEQLNAIEKIVHEED